ncbi:hemerythrin domain-containing protein [Hydrogenophaga pseudoflava]|uniref:hemerythrin domain-containing protein n=1 Tax=Hydrogenophaga pseudoflava TaxID=47421 RepID=UPI0008256191|nr:hemerythrin domain-containing protein [Hydrogenophaga pseudoflava]
MNIDKLKHQHQDIIGAISALRTLAQAGVAQNAADIARLVVSMSSTIKLHLAVEDQALYPALRRGGNPELARMGQQYQEDMGPIAQAYDAFARRWNRPESVRSDEQGFRDDANRVLRMVHERMQRENRDFYPRIEVSTGSAGAAHCR